MSYEGTKIHNHQQRLRRCIYINDVNSLPPTMWSTEQDRLVSNYVDLNRDQSPHDTAVALQASMDDFSYDEIMVYVCIYRANNGQTVQENCSSEEEEEEDEDELIFLLK